MPLPRLRRGKDFRAVDGAERFVADLGQAGLEHFHVAKDRFARRQRRPPAIHCLGMNPQRAGEGEVGRGVDHSFEDLALG